MTGDEQQDLVTAYVLGELDDLAAARFEAEAARDPEVRKLLAETEEAFAALALDCPLHAPPLAPFLGALQALPARKPPGRDLLPWALAASLAIACSILAISHTQLHRELAASQKKEVLAEMKIAMLRAQTDAYAHTVAVVIWDAARQHGMLKLAQLPPPGSGHDYQLWVIDPKQATPVSAGLVVVGADGLGQAEFRPSRPVSGQDKFAVSLERAGGAPSPQGQIILVGE